MSELEGIIYNFAFEKQVLKKLERFQWFTYFETFFYTTLGSILSKKKDRGIWLMNNMDKQKGFDFIWI